MMVFYHKILNSIFLHTSKFKSKNVVTRKFSVLRNDFIEHHISWRFNKMKIGKVFTEKYISSWKNTGIYKNTCQASHNCERFDCNTQKFFPFVNYCTKEKSTNGCFGRYNYHSELEDAINEQIALEFSSGYNYLAMSCYFGRTDVSLHGCRKAYFNMFEEENSHAVKLIRYQLERGGDVKLCRIPEAKHIDDCSICKSLEIALEMEKLVTDKLTDIVSLAQKHKDLRTEDFIITEFITEQIEATAQLSALLARANRIGLDGLSVYLFDEEMGSKGGHSGAKK